MAHELPIVAVQVALEHHVRADRDGYPRYVRRKRVNLIQPGSSKSPITTTPSPPAACTAPGVMTPEAALRQMAAGMRDGIRRPAASGLRPADGPPYPVGSLVALNTGEIAAVIESQASARAGPEVEGKNHRRQPTGRRSTAGIDLAERDGGSDAAPSGRRISSVLDADAYGIRVAGHFLARASGRLPA